jgi:hypothetical protein
VVVFKPPNAAQRRIRYMRNMVLSIFLHGIFRLVSRVQLQ